MLVGGRIAFEPKNMRIVFFYDDKRDVSVKSSGFVNGCLAEAETMITREDIEGDAKRAIEKKREVIAASTVIPKKEKSKVLSALESGEEIKKQEDVSRTRLVYIKAQELSKARFANAVNELESCFRKIAVLTGQE